MRDHDMFLSHLYRDYATYWEPDGTDMYGDSSYKDPVHLRVIWEDRTQLVVNEQNEEVRSQARVFLLQDVKNGGWIMQGVSNDAKPPAEASRILAFHKTRRLYGHGYERKVFL